MHFPTMVIAAILMAVTFINGDKEKFFAKHRDFKRISIPRPDRPPRPNPCPTEEEADSPGCTLKVECKSRKGEPGLRGLPGIDGRRGRGGETGLPGMKGDPGDSAVSGSSVAFFVALDRNKGLLRGEVLQFKHVLVNYGSAYDPDTGRFTAPTSGVYVFNLVVAPQKGEKAAIQLLKTVDGFDNWVVTVLAEGLTSWATSSNTVYLSLTQGQRVFLTSTGNHTSYYYANMYTTFSGSLVAPSV